MNAKRPEPPPISLTQIATDKEIEEAVDEANHFGLPAVALLIRRLAYQLDCHVNKVTYLNRPTSPLPPRKKP